MGHFEDYLHSAALTIQKRYHGWKGRKDFLRICNRIVKVQLLVHTEFESCLKSKLNPTHLEVVDTSGGCGASFVVEIVSEEFEGKRLLERHRMVNAALEEEMKEIHALSFKKAVIPEQWKQLQQDSNQANPAA
ncbi:protein BOLA2-like [Arachis ipaensis]|uniref:protein BOLA2-like n=1 Tax=Arachis ipaensis TaxID=130454 RepID=UPI0007AF874B|nr:protein BOLA2-like [Arachis ipaensis]XP_025652721.1 protein BOLA2-like [Arachis hypogaea]